MTAPTPHARASMLAAAVLAACAAMPAWAQNDALLARNLAATCANCHGTNGNARGEMRPLAGMEAERVVRMMTDYKSGLLTGTIMHQIAKGYTDEQIRLIAGYLAAQKPAAR